MPMNINGASANERTPQESAVGPGGQDADLLSVALASMKVDSSAIFVFDFFGDWGVEINYPHGFSWTVIEGQVFLSLAKGSMQVFNAGDTFIFPRGTVGKSYTFLGSPQSKAVAAEQLWGEAQLPKFKPGVSLQGPRQVQWGAGAEKGARIVSTAFGFNDRRLGPLVEALPEMMVIRAPQVSLSVLQPILNSCVPGDVEPQPGFTAIAAQSVQLFDMLAVRAYALNRDDIRKGWLGGLSDPKIARALAAVHNQPGRRWSVAGLAKQAGMSRSLFAERFLACVGEPPLRYIGSWRMHLAREALAIGKVSVTTLAQDLGYLSEAAFRTAFKKCSGFSPREFVKQSKQATQL